MKKNYLILLIILISPLISVCQTDLYVATNGSDFNDGSIASPYRNIQKACNVATPGSTVYINAGVYYENIIMNVSGSENNFITFKPFEDGEVVVDGDYKNATLLEISNQSFIKIQNIVFRNANGNGAIGVLIQGNSSNISFQFCEITNISFTNDINELANESSNSHPFIAFGNNASFPIQNLIINNTKINLCRPGYSNSIEINGNIEDFKLVSNTITQNENTGMAILGHKGICLDSDFDQPRNGTIKENKVYSNNSPYESSAGIYIDGGKSVLIEKNRIYKNHFGIIVGCENPEFITSLNTIRDNIIYLNDFSGLNVGNFESNESSGLVKNCNFTNNSLFRNERTQPGLGEIVATRIQNCSFFNNIISSNSQNIMLSANFSIEANNIFNYNNWHSNSNQEEAIFNFNDVSYNNLIQYKAGTGFETNSFFGNPDFVDPSNSNPDLHLSSISTSINAGNPFFDLNSETDFEGNDRIIGGRIDIGCYEYDMVTGISEIENKGNHLILWPNPAAKKIHILNSRNDLITKISIFDLAGNIVQSITDGGIIQSSILDIENFTNGIYFISMSTDKEILSTKFIKN